MALLQSLPSTVQNIKYMKFIIHKHVSEDYSTNNILTPEQHGFRNNHFNSTVLLQLLNDVTKIFDDGTFEDTLTVDFVIAFDSISHGKRIYKLQFYGSYGIIHLWIIEFLCNRTFM